MQELEKIDEMFETINNKMEYLSYSYTDYINDTIAIWDYVKEKLGKPKTQRFIEVEE